uniref:Uncharacterized protein n=1 Tax=viral metagenome TaxID=1070528 RepID=A0A6M3J4I8_9ZZZZ
MTKRSLYQCFNCKVIDKIYCSMGHRLVKYSSDGTINKALLIRGDPLELSVCQGCPDYDEMGPPVKKEDRGWMDLPSGKIEFQVRYNHRKKSKVGKWIK